MSTNLIQFKSFLGKYYPELAYSVIQEKYIKAGIDKVFEQRYNIQGNKTQMIVDPALKGLIINVTGNEIFISKELYDHPEVIVSNSMESPVNTNPKSLYNAETFSTLAYLVCQNHTTFQITGKVDKPIYIKYKSDFETFYNSVIVFNIDEECDAEIVEEFESLCVLNSVTNYILNENSKLNLYSFYQNHIPAVSFCFRNIIVKENAILNHILFGKGSALSLDETKIHPHSNSTTNITSYINPGQKEFHSILDIHASSIDYNFQFDQRHVLIGKGKSTFTKAYTDNMPLGTNIYISSLVLDPIPENERMIKVEEFLSPISEKSKLERNLGSERFYINKSKFLDFQ